MRRLEIPASLRGLRSRIRRRLEKPEEAERPPKEHLRPEFLAGLKRLDLRAKLLLQGFLQGVHPTRRRGFSAEFSDYRTFVPGDDPRWMDWRVYARTDRLYVKRFEAESALRATLVLDASASMGYRSPATGSYGAPAFTKLGYAVTLAAAFAYLLQYQRDRVGLLAIGGAEEKAKNAPPSSAGCHLPPRSSRNHVLRVLQALSALRSGGDAGVPAALEAFAARERRRGLIMLFTDALCHRAPLLEALKRLKHRGHDVIVFQIWDPGELDPVVPPGVSFRDPETGAKFAPLPREEYDRRVQTHLAELRRGCLAVPAEYQFLQTTTPFDRALLRFLTLRKKKH